MVKPIASLWNRQQLVEFLGHGPRSVHLMGIGGAGMSGLARLLLQQGHQVSGCDRAPNGEGARLRRLGARVQTGHAANHIHAHTDLLVYSSAIPRAEAELTAAVDRGVPVVQRGLLLSALMNHRCNIAVAGSHGKTTTTALLAQILKHGDSAPSFCVGAQVPVLGTNAQLGAGQYFVAEVCESDGTLVGFTPHYAICLNVEAEHLDYHGSLAALQETFRVFLDSALKTVFYCADCPTAARLGRQARSGVSFGLAATADYQAVDLEATARGTRFRALCRGQEVGRFELVIPGRQNVVNALAAIAVADELGLPMARVATALASFTGAQRRFDRKFEGNGLVVVDDYAHHPTEIRATIAAARALRAADDNGQPAFRRILVAFQPHRYSRTAALLPDFATAFDGVDRLFVADIYAASEPARPELSGRTVAEAVVAARTGAVTQSLTAAAVSYQPDFTALADQLARAAQPGDLILTMGAGDIYQVADTLAEQLTAGAPPVISPVRRAQAIGADLAKLLSERTRVQPAEPMTRHTTLRIGGPAEFWIEPWDERDLARTLRYAHEQQIPLTIVGRGSNLLVTDRGIPGLVVHLGSAEFCRVEVDGERIIARAGARLRTVVNLSRQQGLGGLEFLEGIPGSVGGALRMNAGAMGHQTFDVLDRVRYVSRTGEIYEAEAGTLPVSYRSCPVFTTHVALTAIFRGQPTAPAEIAERLRVYERQRWSSQPARPSAGCIFKNPESIAAGRLVEELGLKGTTIGGAQVSEVHGNFIVNEGGATAADVLQLIDLIRHRARRDRGIELEPEVMIVGAGETRGE